MLNGAKFVDFDIWNHNGQSQTQSQSQSQSHQQKGELSQYKGASNLVKDNGNSIVSMEFIQVLIHQHAKTLVALQDLQKEVTSLKSPHSIQHHSAPVPLIPLATHSNYQLPHNLPHNLPNNLAKYYQHQPCCCGNVNPNIITGAKQDSGFTEIKQKLDDDEDELYSLLSLIQFKVQKYSSRKTDRRNNEVLLGSLDSCLGNEDFDFKKFKLVDKGVIREVLGCRDLNELRRQLLFTLARVKTLEEQEEMAGPSNQSQNLITENERLKFELKQMEIELEGTNAKLRILGKNCDKLSDHPLQLLHPVTPAPISPQSQSHSPNPPIKSLSSISSNNQQKSLIPIPVARLKNANKKIVTNKSPNKNNNNNNLNKNYWAQWFS